MRLKGLALMLTGVILWALVQWSSIFLYEVPNFFTWVGTVLFIAGLMSTALFVPWDKNMTFSSLVVSVITMLVSLAGFGILLGRFLEYFRGSILSWGTVAAIGAVIVTMWVVGAAIILRPQIFESKTMLVISFVVISVLGAIFSNPIVGMLGFPVRNGEGVMTTITLTGVLVVAFSFALNLFLFKRLSPPEGKAYQSGYDLPRGWASVLLAESLVWPKLE